MKMQKHLTRIKTGFILGLLTIMSVFYLPDSFFSLLCFLIVSAAFWEWLSLIQLRSIGYKFFLMFLFFYALYLMQQHILDTFYLATGFWILALIMIILPLSQLGFLKNNRFFQFLIGLIILAPTWVALVSLHHENHLVLFYVIMLVTFADTSAYFVGSHFGRHKLSPTISPKKSFEGLLGGLIGGSIAGSGVLLFMPNMTPHHFMLWFIFGLFIILISVLGDLFESLLKRLYGTKDSGSLLPGHGGLLDRLDSLSAALPIYALICFLAPVF